MTEPLTFESEITNLFNNKSVVNLKGVSLNFICKNVLNLLFTDALNDLKIVNSDFRIAAHELRSIVENNIINKNKLTLNKHNDIFYTTSTVKKENHFGTASIFEKIIVSINNKENSIHIKTKLFHFYEDKNLIKIRFKSAYKINESHLFVLDKKNNKAKELLKINDVVVKSYFDIIDDSLISSCHTDYDIFTQDPVKQTGFIKSPYSPNITKNLINGEMKLNCHHINETERIKLNNILNFMKEVGWDFNGDNSNELKQLALMQFGTLEEHDFDDIPF